MRSTGEYYTAPAREPTAADDYGALSRALTVKRLDPYADKVVHLRHPAEVRRLRRNFKRGSLQDHRRPASAH